MQSPTVSDISEAKRIAESWIHSRYPDGSVGLMLDRTREEPFGWVFFYQTRDYIDTGDFRSQLAGNAPIVVMRDSGEVEVTGTARPLDEYLDRFRSSP